MARWKERVFIGSPAVREVRWMLVIMGLMVTRGPEGRTQIGPRGGVQTGARRSGAAPDILYLIVVVGQLDRCEPRSAGRVFVS
jgi:hypothetical protein